MTHIHMNVLWTVFLCPLRLVSVFQSGVVNRRVAMQGIFRAASFTSLLTS